MTNNEIIKALECCVSQDDERVCDKCPIQRGTHQGKWCDTILLENALDLINRLKAENARLKQERDKEHDNCNHYARMCVKAKSEAYKEFAERLCADRVSNDPVVIAVKAELKEMG